MIYAISDLHGCYGKYIKMLEKIEFHTDDTLYILGDIVDRGPDGIKIWQDIIERKNIIALRGNHDFLAYWLLKKLRKASDSECLDFERDDRFAEIYQSWIFDGGLPTEEQFNKLNEAEQNKILSHMRCMPIYDEIEVGKKKFFLAHTVPGKKRMQDFHSLLWQEFIIGEPEYEREYFPDKFIVTGHTPTGLIDPQYKGRIWQRNNHIAIDCGAVFGNPLGCICLDTLEEYYTDTI